MIVQCPGSKISQSSNHVLSGREMYDVLRKKKFFGYAESFGALVLKNHGSTALGREARNSHSKKIT